MSSRGKGKLDRAPISLRLTEEEEAKVRLAAAKMDMDVSVSMKKAWACGIGILLTNELARRMAEIKDVKVE